MNINKISLVNKILKPDKANLSKNTIVNTDFDKVSLSSEAKKQQEIAKLSDIVKRSPDIRADKVAEIKQKISEENYFENVSFDKLSENLFNALRLK